MGARGGTRAATLALRLVVVIPTALSASIEGSGGRGVEGRAAVGERTSSEVVSRLPKRLLVWRGRITICDRLWWRLVRTAVRALLRSGLVLPTVWAKSVALTVLSR